MIDANNLNFEKLEGIIPAVITDKSTGQVLMLGFMNKEAYQKTLETKKVTFYSRSKGRLWTKGETSGNYLELVDIKPDCDNDTLLISANPRGNTCHLDQYSCFGIEEDKLGFLNDLFSLIKERKNELPEGSYTTKLFNAGENRIIQKVGEEAIETVIAAKNSDREEIINEVSDLIYHLFVMLVEKNISVNEIAGNLYSRHKS
jgi:phosphoribosyl-ATP pyrophosphohydrolase/phosphoribosyl-AMP cyclohydrolase